MRNKIKSLLIWLLSFLNRDTRPKIVFYHDVGTRWTPMGTPQNVFWAHMRHMRSDDIVTFDDGFHGVWDERDALRLHGIRPIVFVAPRLVGKTGYLSWDELRILQRDYGFDVQCHTWSHQTLAGKMIDESPIGERTEDWYNRELIESREKIVAEIGAPVTGLCLPAGNFNDELIMRCQMAGYKKIYMSYPGNRCGDFVQPRCLVQDLGIMGFKAVLNGGMNLLAKRYVRKQWCA